MVSAQEIPMAGKSDITGIVDTRKGGRKVNPKRNLCQWLTRPRYNPDNNTSEGYLDIEGQIYRVTEVQFIHDESGYGGRLWKLTKDGTNDYQVTLDADGNLSCDCPDAVFGKRECGCKHARAIKAAYEFLEIAAALDRWINDELACDEAYGPEPTDAPF